MQILVGSLHKWNTDLAPLVEILLQQESEKTSLAIDFHSPIPGKTSVEMRYTTFISLERGVTAIKIYVAGFRHCYRTLKQDLRDIERRR